MIERKRVLLLFWELVKQEEYVRACDLAKKLGVSDRTIKNDMAECKQFALKSGTRLLSKKRYGYKIEVVDEQRFAFVKEQLGLYVSTMGSKSDESYERIREILQLMIVEEDYLTLDELADRLYLTKFSLREEMKEVHEIIESYHCHIKHSHEKGAMIQGREFHKRHLMLDVLENYHHNALPLNSSIVYDRWFKIDEEECRQIRQIILKNIRASQCRIKDFVTIKLVRYFCLMKKRTKAGYFVELTEAEQTSIRSKKEWPMMQKIFNDLQHFEGFDPSEEEKLAATIYVSAQLDLSFDCDLSVFEKDKIQETEAFIDAFYSVLKKDYQIDCSALKNVKQALVACLYPLIIQKDFGMCSYIQIINYTFGEKIINPLALAFANEAAQLFKKMYKMELNTYNTLLIQNCLRTLFTYIDYDFTPIRFAIVSDDGLCSAQMIADMLNSRFAKYIAKADAYELYELRSVAQQEYDVVISTFSDLEYYYAWPLVQMKTIPSQSDMNNIYNQCILSQVDFQTPLSTLKLDHVHFYKSFETNDCAEFINFIAFKLGKDNESIKAIKKEMQHEKKHFAANEFAVFFIKRKYVNQPVLEIYELQEKVKIGHETVQYIIVMSPDFNFSLKSLRCVHDFFFIIYFKPEKLVELIKNEDKEIMIAAIKEYLKAVSISLKPIVLLD